MESNSSLVIFDYVLKIGIVVIGGILLEGIRQGIKAIWNLSVKIEKLEEKIKDIMAYGPRLDKVEEDTDEAHYKIRELQSKRDNGSN